MRPFKLKWKSKQAIRDLSLYLRRRMALVASYIDGQIKLRISRANSNGKNPSRPGEPPKLRTGILRSNIGHEVRISANKTVTAYVGVRNSPAAVYGKALEQTGLRDGTKRPFIKSTVLLNRAKIIEILVR